MNLPEEKWPVQHPQVGHSHHHPNMPAVSGMPDGYIGYSSPYGEHPQPSPMPVHEGGQHHLYMPPGSKPEDGPRPGFQTFVAMPQPSTPRPGTGSPTNGSAPSTPVEERKHLEGRSPPFTSSFHSAPFQAGIRKRRADSIFPVEAGPFFSTTKQLLNLSSMDRSNGYKVRINAKVGRFFLADSDWTCYRRNYFQVSSAFSIQGTNAIINDPETPCLVEIDGQFQTVNTFLLGITARVSNSDKKIELVQHTPKRDKGPQITPLPKAVRSGGNLNLSSVGSNQNIVTFERVQFKTATANNGKRRAAQQYYVIIVDLFVQTESGDTHKVATCQSAPLVVRGRSPGHYADNHDRFNHMQMGPPSPDERFLASYRNTPGTPVGMPGDYNSYSPYSPYQPYPQFSPVNPPMRNDTLSMLMSNPSGGAHPSYPHPPQPYMVPSISDGSNSESPSPDMYTNEFSPDPNDPNAHPNHHTPKLAHMPPPGHPHHQPIGLNIQGVHGEGPDAWNRARQNSSASVTSFVSSSTSSHSNEEPQYPAYANGASHPHDGHHGHSQHSAFTSFDSRQPPPAAGYQPHDYDEFQWHNGNHQQHHHNYHPEGTEQPYPHANGNSHANGHSSHAPESNSRPHDSSNPGSKPSSRGASTSSSAPNSGSSSSQWDQATSRTHPGTPTQELGKQMMNFRIAKLEEAGEKL